MQLSKDQFGREALKDSGSRNIQPAQPQAPARDVRDVVLVAAGVLEMGMCARPRKFIAQRLGNCAYSIYLHPSENNVQILCALDEANFAVVVAFGTPEPSEEQEQVAGADSLALEMCLRRARLPEDRTPPGLAWDRVGTQVGIEM